MVEYLSVPIEQLLLDEQNPRLVEVSSQSEALQALIDLKPDHFKTMMVSIRDNGLDPGDSLYVIESEDGNDLITLDGNRRASALKVLTNPELLQSVSISPNIDKQLRTVASKFRPESNKFHLQTCSTVRCVKFSNRNDANDWIERRHLNSANGEGRINWGPLEIQRFSGDRSLLDILDFIGREAKLPPADWAALKKDIESKRSSTLSRLVIESPLGREHLGIRVQESSDGQRLPYMHRPIEWTLSTLMKILRDLSTGEVDSRKANTADAIKSYFEGLPPENQPDSTTIIEPIAFREAGASASPSKVTQKPKPKKATVASPRRRTTLAPRRHSHAHPGYEKGNILLHEATKLNPNTMRVCSAFALRSFIELSIHDYAKKHNLSGRKADGSELTLTQKLEATVNHMTSTRSCAPDDVRALKNMFLQPTSTVHIQMLNSFVHNRFAVPDQEALKNGWDAAVPLFQAAFGHST